MSRVKDLLEAGAPHILLLECVGASVADNFGRLGLCFRRGCERSFFHCAVASIAARVLVESFGEMLLLEVGPQDWREIQLGVGAFPEHEVAESAIRRWCG